MALHGRRGISAIVLGSETVKLLTHSTIPALVYRGPRSKLSPYFAAYHSVRGAQVASGISVWLTADVRKSGSRTA